jgi:hypothetical protein
VSDGSAAELPALAAAVPGAAGWRSVQVPVPGAPDQTVRQYTNARTMLSIWPRDGRLALVMPSRLPLVVKTSRGEAAERRDFAPDILRLIVEYQDRLGEPAADASFWRALLAAGITAWVVHDGKDNGTLDWSRMDHDGQPQGGYLLRCACHELQGKRPDIDPSVLRVVGEVRHEGWSEIFAQCGQCARRWKIDEDTGYHFPTYSWTDVTFDPAHAHHFGPAADDTPGR